MANWQDLMKKEGRLPAWPWPIRYDVENEISADVLVLGGGIAGCHAAINAARKGAKVVVCDTAHMTISGQGGAGVDHWQMVCTNPCSKVTPEEMTEAVVEDGYGGYDCGIKRYIECRESYDTLLDVEKMGVQVRDVNDEFKGAEFRDDKTKLMFCYDYENKYSVRVCGSAIKPSLYKEMQRQGVKVLNWVRITSLLTEGGKTGARVIGATAVNVRTGEFYVLKAKATISCMGSVRHLWVFSTELKGAADTLADINNSGASYATAWNAGAELALMEKTMHSMGGFSYPNYGAGNANNTWYACNMVDANGKEIPWVDRDGKVLKTVSERYRPAPGQKFFLMGGGVVEIMVPDEAKAYKYRSPRLIPDLAERIRKGEYTPPLYADLPSMPPLERRAIWGLMVGAEGKTRSAIYANYGRAGFDPDKDMLQATITTTIGGGGHAGGPPGWLGIGFDSGGGIVMDWDMRTTLEGLYVAGNPMLGGSNHTEAATSGRYAGRTAAEYTRTAPEPVVDRNQVKAEKSRVYAPVKRESGIGWKELHAGIARIMQDYCGEERHEAILKTGLRYFKEIKESEVANACARNPHELLRFLDCLDRLTSGEMIMHASLARKASSRWLSFKRIDYPQIDPPEWKKWVTIKQKDGEVQVGELPINYWLLPPYAPTYQENYERHCSLEEGGKRS